MEEGYVGVDIHNDYGMAYVQNTILKRDMLSLAITARSRKKVWFDKSQSLPILVLKEDPVPVKSLDITKMKGQKNTYLTDYWNHGEHLTRPQFPCNCQVSPKTRALLPFRPAGWASRCPRAAAYRSREKAGNEAPLPRVSPCT